MLYDVLIVGGGPAGLSAAMALGRGRKRVLLCDAGPRRNAAAVHVHNFITRDGVPPGEFRRIARAELSRYANVDTREEPVISINGASGAFDVGFSSGSIRARRVLLCTGVIDELPDIDGFRELWGASIFQCPYCHGWEVQDQRFAYLAANTEALTFALFLRGWTRDVVALTHATFDVADGVREKLASGGVTIEERPIRRLLSYHGRLTRIELGDGTFLDRDVVFAHPPQRQVDLVSAVGVALDDKGFVQVNETTRETSIPGIYAAGDLAPSVQGGQSAILSAAAGMRAAAMINHTLTIELATTGALT
jgi:thioredoxin reductase